MSIIIKGMKMPQKEGDYAATLHVNRDGTALIYLHKDFNVYHAKELPPHGDLIDMDHMLEEARADWAYSSYDLTDLPEFASYLPVVIPKEEEEDGQ